MGCVCSRRFPEDAPPATAYDARRGRYGPGDFDSGELAIPPPKPPHSHKVPTFPPFPRWLIPPHSLSLSPLPAPSFLLPASLHACCCVCIAAIAALFGACMEVRCCCSAANSGHLGDTAADCYPDSIGYSEAPSFQPCLLSDPAAFRPPP